MQHRDQLVSECKADLVATATIGGQAGEATTSIEEMRRKHALISRLVTGDDLARELAQLAHEVKRAQSVVDELVTARPAEALRSRVSICAARTL